MNIWVSYEHSRALLCKYAIYSFFFFFEIQM